MVQEIFSHGRILKIDKLEKSLFYAKKRVKNLQSCAYILTIFDQNYVLITKGNMLKEKFENHFNTSHLSEHNHLGEDWYYMPSNKICWEEHTITSVVFLQKMHIHNLIMRKHWTNQNWGTFCKAADLRSSKIQGQEAQKMTEEFFQIKHKKMWQLNVMHKPRFDPRLGTMSGYTELY